MATAPAVASPEIGSSGDSFRGPVIESNGLRARMASALRSRVGVEPAGAARCGPVGMAASWASSGARRDPTICVMAYAWKNAAIVTIDRITTQKWRLRS